MATKYRVSPYALHQNPQMTTQIDGAPVSLSGKPILVIREATKELPEFKREARVATQKDLERLHKDGHPFIEEYDEEAKEFEPMQIGSPVPENVQKGK